MRLIQNEGTGLIAQGTREWRDYRVTADVTPHMVEAAGVAARVQGMRRYYALQLRRGNRVQLVRMVDTPAVLAEAQLDWEFGDTHVLVLEVQGTHIQGFVDGRLMLDVNDTAAPDGALADGAAGLVVTQGRTETGSVRVARL